MTGITRKQQHLESVLRTQPLPADIHLRGWQATDFPAIQRLSNAEDWPTPNNRPEEALRSWEHSEPALVLYKDARLIGFVRGLTDGEVTTYITELLVDANYRNKGYGRLLLDICHALHPHTRLDLISTEESTAFYKKAGFRDVGTGLRKSYR